MTTKTLISKPRQKRLHHNPNHDVKSQQPIIPMNKVSLDVIKKLQTEPYPQLNLATHSTISDALELYYNEYVRLFRLNQVLNDDLASILLERNSLADQFNQIKKMKSYDDNIRRRRRYASEIQRNYHCPMPKCNKGYGSEGSLTHHVRLKHPKFFQSGEYEIYLQTEILPKQEIKNQDNKRIVNVQEIQGNIIKKSYELKGNNVKVIDDDLKEAKQQDNQKDKDKILRNHDNPNNTVGECSQQSFGKKRQKSTHQMNNIMRQVDEYILLEPRVEQSQKEECQNIGQNTNKNKALQSSKQTKKVIDSLCENKVIKHQ